MGDASVGRARTNVAVSGTRQVCVVRVCVMQVCVVQVRVVQVCVVQMCVEQVCVVQMCVEQMCVVSEFCSSVVPINFSFSACNSAIKLVLESLMINTVI